MNEYIFGVSVRGVELENVSFSKNSIYLELGGSAGIHSVNYEYFLRKTILTRVGFSVMPSEDYSYTFPIEGEKIYSFYSEMRSNNFFIPLTVSKLLGGVNSRSKIELGLSVVGKISSTATTDYYDNDEKEPEIFKDLAMLTSLTAILGYRYQPPVDGVSFRVVYTPLYHTPHDLLRFGLV